MYKHINFSNSLIKIASSFNMNRYKLKFFLPIYFSIDYFMCNISL